MLDELVARAARLTEHNGRAILGITGAPGAGKSTVARSLVEALGAIAVELPMDGFHLADATLERLGRARRKGAIDTFDGDGYLAMLRRARTETDHTVYAPNFDRTTEQPIAASIAIEPHVRLVVTEGNYLLATEGAWSQVRRELDEVWFVEVDDDLRRRRLVERHVRFGKSPAAAETWVGEVDEANARLIAARRDSADLVVDLSAIPMRPRPRPPAADPAAV